MVGFPSKYPEHAYKCDKLNGCVDPNSLNKGCVDLDSLNKGCINPDSLNKGCVDPDSLNNAYKCGMLHIFAGTSDKCNYRGKLWTKIF